nr:protein preY mitochondrial [Hymenolepis microstoma]
MFRSFLCRVPKRFNSSTPTFDPKHLEVLVCPLSKGPLTYDSEKQLLINKELKIAYKINDGIPNLIPEDALNEF